MNDNDLAIQRLVLEQMKREMALIERVVEASIQSGKDGVLVVRDNMGALVSASVSDQVPYGYVHEKRV